MPFVHWYSLLKSRTNISYEAENSPTTNLQFVPDPHINIELSPSLGNVPPTSPEPIRLHRNDNCIASTQIDTSHII